MNNNLISPEQTTESKQSTNLTAGHFIIDATQKTPLSSNEVEMLYEIDEIKTVLANIFAMLKNSISAKDFYAKANIFVHKNEQDLYQKHKSVVKPLIDYLRHKAKKEDANDFPNQLEVDLKFFADFLNNVHN